MLAWAYSFGTSSSTFIFINKDGANAKENLQRLKEQIECLPNYLQFDQILEEDESGKLKLVKAVKNATSMRHPITKNRIIIKSKATNYESALSLARGMTAPIIHSDEPEFTAHIKTIVENSVSTYETAARTAKANGALYGRIFTCTPKLSLGVNISNDIKQNTINCWKLLLGQSAAKLLWKKVQRLSRKGVHSSEWKHGAPIIRVMI